METSTKIGTACIVRARMGSIALPSEITLACPRCGELVADKGQCLAEFRPVDYQPNGSARLAVMVDCRNCACTDEAPLVVPTL